MTWRRSDVGISLATASAVAGAIHVLAVTEHAEHPHIALFFALLASAQVAWAILMVARPTRALFQLGVLANATVIGIWVISRTTGVPFIHGIEEPESIGPLDVTATLLEVGIVAGSAWLLSDSVLERFRVTGRELATSALALGLIAVALPGALGTPIGGHSHQHGDHVHAIAGGHGDIHEHDPTSPSHDHSGTDGSGHHDGDTHVSAHGELAHTVAHSHDAVATEAGHAHSAAGVPPFEPRGIRKSVRYGPFTIGPSEQTHGSNPAVTNIIRTQLEAPCTDCYLTAMEPDLVYTDGSSANFDTGMMLHHTVLGNSRENDLTCGRSTTIGWMGERFFASGNERTKGILPPPYGYHVAAGDWWTGVFEIMNMTDAPQTVWFEFTVHYVRAADGGVEPITPVWLDVDNCEDSQYSIPAGRSVTPWDWTSTVSGRLVFAGGHVHNWGRSIELQNVSSGEKVCKSVAGYGTKPEYQGNIESMSTCVWDRIGTVREGDTMRISALYESPQAHDDVMGIMVAYIYETTDLSGGTKAPDSVTDPPDGPEPEHPHDH